jgi:hypothetical protein
VNVNQISALDIDDPRIVEVELQDRPHNGTSVLYVHVDGMTVLRVRVPSTATVKYSGLLRTEPTEPEPDRRIKLTCHACRHQQHRTENDVEICEVCGSDQVWV